MALTMAVLPTATVTTRSSYGTTVTATGLTAAATTAATVTTATN